MSIQYLSPAAGDATRLASRLDVPAHEIAWHRFPDGELRVTVDRPAPTSIIYAPLDRPNDKLIALLFAAEALRRDGAGRLVLMAPYLCYMRQDTAFQAGEAISQKVVGRLLSDVFDRIITVDAHLHRTSDIRDVFPGIEVDNLSAMLTIANELRASRIDPASVVVGPDAESRPWASDLATRLGLDHAVGTKVRRGDTAVEIEFDDIGLFAGRPVLLVDDIVSSGGTLIACAKSLAEAGAVAIDVIVTHALFSPSLASDLTRHGIRSIRSTHSVPHPTNAFLLDDILVETLRREVSGTVSPAKPS